jgi:hypothetical protein
MKRTDKDSSANYRSKVWLADFELTERTERAGNMHNVLIVVNVKAATKFWRLDEKE